MKLEFISDKNPIQRVNEAIKVRLIKAQKTTPEKVFANAADLFAKSAEDLKIAVSPPEGMEARTALDLSDRPLKELMKEIVPILAVAGIPASAQHQQATTLAHRIQLLRAFDDPDAVLRRVIDKVTQIVRTFPKNASDIERGRNPGDVLDPYILAATQGLLYQGDFQGAVEASVAHKALMIIEGLLGHLHEEVIGEVRGNIKAPEPRGVNQEIIDLDTNPFPGADVVQPPHAAGQPIRFHQVKSKTGSAKGGDGRRLGAQLKMLNQYYSGEIYYDALIGTTLRGQRSMNGVLTEAPNAIVLVGSAAFKSLTRSSVGPELLLRVYQNAFAEVARQSGYHIDQMATRIVETFKERADAAGEGFLEVVLAGSTAGTLQDQDIRHFTRNARHNQVSATEN